MANFFARKDAPGRGRRRVVAALIGIGTVAGTTIAISTPAFGWTQGTWNCEWANSSLRLGVSTTSGSYRTTLIAARDNYNAKTDVTITVTTATDPAWEAFSVNAGATGWEGQEARLCLTLGTKSWSDMRINTYYAASKTDTNKKVIWLHEMGHSLGIDHVSSAYRVMYTSASTAYSNGITQLTSDEIAGINYLY